MVNAILKKLHFKPGFKILTQLSAEEVASILGDISSIELSSINVGSYDGILLFVKNSNELKQTLETWAARINSDVVTWIAYPKKTSVIVTDLKMAKWDELEQYKLSPCGSVSLDDTWTGLRIKPIADIKQSGVGNMQIKSNDFAEYIDIDNKKVYPPADLSKMFLQHPNAAIFFKALAYSHQKEYVLWILTAKQEVTRTNRLQKTIEMLSIGKKYPTMK